MKRILLILIFLACACERVDVPSGGPDKDSDTRKILYASAVSYPEGYDWRKDSLGMEAGVGLILFKEGKEILCVPLSGGAVPDPDMHWIAGGHLYNEYFKDGQTFVCRDGRAFYKTAGIERAVSTCVTDSTMFTLSTVAPGGKWVLRGNGTELLSGPGTLNGGLYSDNGEMCFSFEDDGKFCFVAGKTVSVLAPPDGADRILACRRSAGRMNTLCRKVKTGHVLWGKEDGTVELDYDVPNIPGNTRDWSFIQCGDVLMAHFQVWRVKKKNTGPWNDVFISPDGHCISTGGEEQVLALCGDSPVLCHAHSPSGNSCPVTIFFNDREYPVDEGCRMLSTDALCCRKDGFFAGMNDVNGRPVIIGRDNASEYDFNGYFTHLSLP